MKLHANDGVGTQFFGLIGHTVDRLLAAFGKQLGVFGDFTADDAPEACHDVFAHMARTDGITTNKAERTHDVFFWNSGRCDNYHFIGITHI